MSIETNLRRLIDSKEQIRQAIITKGVDVDSSVKIDGYAEKILEIEQCDLDEYYQKYYDEDGNTYIINEDGEKVITREKEIPPTPVVGGNVRWKGIDEVWHEDYYEDGIVPIQKYKGKADMLELEIGEGITKIGDSAFSGCTNITNISISNTVTTIDSGAFIYCSGVTEMIIPDSVTEISNSIFNHCTNLTSVTISDVVTSIGIDSFGSCYNLKRLNSDVDGVFNIPNTVTNIGWGAFQFCQSMTSIEIPSGVPKIDKFTFQGCSSLTSVIIPSSVASIGQSAFSGCSGLMEIEIGEFVTEIGGYSFDQCSKLTNITIHKFVTSIGSSAFRVPTSGTLTCDEQWYNGLSSTNRTNLGNVASKWTKVWL